MFDLTSGGFPLWTSDGLLVSDASGYQVELRLANNATISNWRTGYTNLQPHENFDISWDQNIPAVSSVIGINNFTLKAVDVTPAPYNQPPDPSSGDVDFENCMLTAAAP